jgi:hypothetical protein
MSIHITFSHENAGERRKMKMFHDGEGRLGINPVESIGFLW